MRVKMREKGSNFVPGASLNRVPEWAHFCHLKGSVRAPDTWDQEEKIQNYKRKEKKMRKC